MAYWNLMDLFSRKVETSEISRLIIEHQRYRSSTLNMIPSENLISPAVASAIASDLEARYTLPCDGELDGEKFDNDYRGSRYLIEVEHETKNKLMKLYDVKYVDVRPLAGHLAAMITIGSLLKSGEKISILPFKAGGYDGYIPELLPSLLNIESIELPFDYSSWDLDYEKLGDHFRKYRPNAVVIGHSFPLFPFDLKIVRDEINDILGPETLLFLDASHILGLIAGKTYPNPIKDGADLFYGSTHKTFFGPQRGIILSDREDLMEIIDTDFFWRWQDNCHWGSIAALGIAAEELLM